MKNSSAARRLLGLPAMVLAIVAGCARPDPAPRETAARRPAPPTDLSRSAPSPLDRGSSASERDGPSPSAGGETIGTSVGGRPIRVRRFGRGADSVLIIGGIHGNEPASVRLVEALAGQLADRGDLRAGRSLWIVPAANPDGLAAGTRLNRRGIDLNRNFPAGNRRETARYGSSPLCEPESAALHRLIAEARPRRIVSVHQPAACVDYDGPARELARAASAACGLPVRRLGGKPGSLGSWAGQTLGIPVVTLELPGSASRLPRDSLWERYGAALEAVIENGEKRRLRGTQ